MENLNNYLVHDFFTVHGPPGTGKTFFSSKLISLLTHGWKDFAKSKPLICLCTSWTKAAVRVMETTLINELPKSCCNIVLLRDKDESEIMRPNVHFMVLGRDWEQFLDLFNQAKCGTPLFLFGTVGKLLVTPEWSVESLHYFWGRCTMLWSDEFTQVLSYKFLGLLPFLAADHFAIDSVTRSIQPATTD